MFEHGAKVVKFDLHIHTKSAKTHYADRNITDEEFAARFVQSMVEKDIQIAAVTNHNLFNKREYLAIKSEAESKGVLVLPGVEISLDYGKCGTHVLVIFPEDCAENDAGNSHCVLERFLFNMYPEGSFDKNNTPVKRGDLLSLADVLDNKIKKPCIVMPARADSDGGFIKSLKPAFIEASDARAIAEIGTKYSEIKIGELSFHAFAFALTVHQLRMNNTIEKEFPWIKEVRFSSNKALSNLKIPLNKALNTLIGIRGSGKSTIIESIRYVFEMEAKEDAHYKDNLLQELLGSGGEITVDLVDAVGGEYQIKRTLGDLSRVYQNGEFKPALRPHALWNINYYGQKDLQAMVKDTSHAVGFIDTYLQKELSVLQADENNIKEQLKDLFRKIEKVEQRLNRRKEYEEKLALAEKVIEDFKRKKIADKLKIEADINTDRVRIDQYKESIAAINSTLSKFGEELYPLLGFEFIEQSTLSHEIFQNIKKATENFKAAVNVAVTSIIHDYGKYSEEFNRQYDDFIQKQNTVKEEISKVKREIDIKELSLDDYAKNVAVKEKMNILLNEITQYDKESKKLIEKKEMLLNQLKDTWHKEFLIRQNKVNEINRSQSLVNIRVVLKGNKQDFSDLLKSLLTGSRISNHDRDKIAREMNDGIEITKALSSENNKLKEFLTESSYSKFKAYCSENEYELITHRIPDAVEIEYMGKNVDHLSLGQRASAMIMLLLGLSDMPLIFDQPEDDLDNQMIYGGLVKEILKQKEKRQIIFATHNSNIPVLGDCDQGCICSIENEKMNVVTGSIDTSVFQKAVIDIMEGGREAFERRKEVYGKWI